MSTATTPAAAARPPRPGFKERVNALPRAAKIGLWVLFAIFLFLLPMLNIPVITTEGSDFGGVLFTVSTYVIVALGLNIVVGYAGLLDLGYVGFYAIGAYTVGVLSSQHANLSWIVVLPVAIARQWSRASSSARRRCACVATTSPSSPSASARSCACVWSTRSGSVGRRASPTSRSRRASMVFKVPSLDWSNGVPVVDLSTTSTFLKFGISDFVPYYWLALIVIGLVLLFDILVKNSRVGRAWEATREDEDAAELMGVPDLPLQAARVRARCRHRWPLRGPLRHQVGLHLTRQLHPAAVDPVPGRRRRRWRRQPLGRHRRRDRRRLLPGALP